MSREPGIVAELGRPETPEETAARKAETSRRHRENQTLPNLLIATIVCLGLVLVMVLIVVRPSLPPADPIDYRALAADAGTSLGSEALAPVLPDGWSANAARIEKSIDGTLVWYIGFITPGNRFVAMQQAADAAPGWLTAEAATHFRMASTGTVMIGDRPWEEYDRRGGADVGNYEYVLTTKGATDTVILFGNAEPEEFQILAAALGADLGTPDEKSE